MRTNIEIDDELLSKAMKLSKSKTKKDTVKIALEEYIKAQLRKDILSLKGKVEFIDNENQ